MVDASDLKSDRDNTLCRFKSGPGQIKKPLTRRFFVFINLFSVSNFINPYFLVFSYSSKILTAEAIKFSQGLAA